MKNKTVLIVDDDEEIQKLLLVFIKKLGYQAETKNKCNKSQRVAFLKSTYPDVNRYYVT